MTDRSNPRLGMRQQQKITPGHFLGHRLLPKYQLFTFAFIRSHCLSLTKTSLSLSFCCFFCNYFIGECCPFYCQSHLLEQNNIGKLTLFWTYLTLQCTRPLLKIYLTLHWLSFLMLSHFDCHWVAEEHTNSRGLTVFEGFALTFKLCCYLFPFLSTIFIVVVQKLPNSAKGVQKAIEWHQTKQL